MIRFFFFHVHTGFSRWIWIHFVFKGKLCLAHQKQCIIINSFLEICKHLIHIEHLVYNVNLYVCMQYFGTQYTFCYSLDYMFQVDPLSTGLNRTYSNKAGKKSLASRISNQLGRFKSRSSSADKSQSRIVNHVPNPQQQQQQQQQPVDGFSPHFR